MRDRFLDALSCKPVDRPPVWLMRQAGRSLPPYRSLRSHHSIENLFRTPELAALVTLLPLDLLGVDAAVLFSDILMVAHMFGCKLSFVEGRGPCIDPHIRTEEEMRSFSEKKGIESLNFVCEAAALVKNDTSLPLIGLCGGPFTVATYLFSLNHDEGLRIAKTWIKTNPKLFHQLLEQITRASIAFLKLQQEAGVDVVQVFDSWANHLEGEEFHSFSLHYLQKIIDAVSLPVIFFCRGSSRYPEEIASIGPRGISFDWNAPIDELRARVPASIAVQGNLDPSILKTSPSEIRTHTQQMLSSMRGKHGFIANLGHGVHPDTPIDHVKCFVDTVKEG